MSKYLIEIDASAGDGYGKTYHANTKDEIIQNLTAYISYTTGDSVSISKKGKDDWGDTIWVDYFLKWWQR